MRSPRLLSRTGCLLPLLLGLSFPASLESQIHAAAAANDTAAVRAQLAADPALIEARNTAGATPLHSAASANAFAAAALLLERGAAVEARDAYQRTPLLLCARERGDAALCGLLLSAGADINARDRFGSTSLELAAWRGKAGVVEQLLDAGAALPADRRNLEGLLGLAANQGLVRLFRAVVGAGLDPATQPFLLHGAAAGGAVEIIGALVAAGADVARADENGWTALHYAARDGRAAAVEWLVRRGAPLDARTIAGQSALNVAVEMHHDSIRDFLIGANADARPAQFPVLAGDYLGQAPPGDEPALFARGIVSSVWGLHSSVAFSPDGTMALWAPMVDIPGQLYSQGGVLASERRGGRWSAPAWAPFTGEADGDVPFFAPDGHRIYFISGRPLPGGSEARRERIWYADRTPGGWSEPRPVDDVVNDYPHHWQFSVDAAHTLYFASRVAGGRGAGDLYRSTRSAAGWNAPEPLGSAINTAADEAMPFIAPDGSYLLFSRDFDLFISFAAADGSWLEPQRLPSPINTETIELCPIVSPDGRYLFFISQRGGESHVWWVSAGFIERLRPQPQSRAVAEVPIELARNKTIVPVAVGGATTSRRVKRSNCSSAIPYATRHPPRGASGSWAAG